MKLVTVSFIVLSYALYTEASPAPRSFKIPIPSETAFQHRDGSGVNLARYTQSIYSTLAKHEAIATFSRENVTVGQAPEIRRRDLGTVKSVTQQLYGIRTPEGNLQGVARGNLYVENPVHARLEFPVVFDTAFPRVALPGIDCRNGPGPGEGCVGSQMYFGAGRDLELETPGNVNKLDTGQIIRAGRIYKDDVSLGPEDGRIVAKALRIVSISSASGLYRNVGVAGEQTIGIAGMGLTGSQNTPSLFENLVASDALERPEMGFFFGRPGTPTQGKDHMTLGDHDETAIAGPPVVSRANRVAWVIQCSSILVDGHPAGPATDLMTFVDTGSPYIAVNHAAGDAILSHSNYGIEIQLADPPPEMTMSGQNAVVYAWPCGETPTIEMIFGGVALDMNPLDMRVAELQEDGRPVGDFISEPPILDEMVKFKLKMASERKQPYCLSPFVARGIDGMILGVPFMRNWYTIFQAPPDKDRDPAIVFTAAAGNNDSGENLQEVIQTE